LIRDVGRPSTSGWTIPINNGSGRPFDEGATCLEQTSFQEVVVVILQKVAVQTPERPKSKTLDYRTKYRAYLELMVPFMNLE
jgi:hypothetical protein